MKDRIIQFLAQGLQAARIAEICGCSPEYISEVRNEKGAEQAIVEAKKMIQRAKEQEEQESEYVTLEKKVTQKLREDLPFAEFGEAARLMEILIRRKQHTLINNGTIVQNNNHLTVTRLTIPSVVAPEIVLNDKQEMIAVEGRSLNPMSATGVRSIFEGIRERKQKERETRDLLSATQRALAEGTVTTLEPGEDF